jgi:hypothetical protein
VPAVPPGRLAVVICKGGIRVTMADADLVVSATLVAVTVTELVDATVDGVV